MKTQQAAPGKVILLGGKELVRAYDNGATLKELRKYIKMGDVEGRIFTRKFSTEEELAAYKQGVYDTFGWQEIKLLVGGE